MLSSMALDITLRPMKHPFDNCVPSLTHWDSYAKEMFCSVLSLQSTGFSQLRVPSGKHYGRLYYSSKLSLGDSLSGIIIEEGIFEDNFNSKGPEVLEGSPSEADERGGLIPEEWRSLQQELYKTKADKKQELRRQELENAQLKEFRVHLRRQKIGPESWDENGNVPGSVRFKCQSQFLSENEQQCLESSEMVLDSSLDLASSESELDSDFERHKRYLEKIAETHKQEQRSQAVRQSESDSRLDLWFTQEEKLCLKRSTPDFNKIYSEKWPALHVLVASGQFFFLDQFLKMDVDVNALDEDGYTALQRAVLGRKETAVTQLVRVGANVNVCDRNGATLLHYGAQTGSLNLVRLFVKRGVDVNHPDEDGWTPLHVAVLSGKDDVVRHLLVSGANKFLKNKDGFTPLDICLALGKNFNAHAIAKSLKKLPKADLSYDEVDITQAFPTEQQ